MKKVFTKITIPLIVFCFFGFYACNNEDPSSTQLDPNAPLSVAAAEHYFYNHLIKQPGATVKPGPNETSSSGENWKYLMFKRGYESETPEVTFVEIPLLYNKRPSTLIKEAGNKLDADTEKEMLNASFDRLVLYKKKGTSEIDQRIITYIPDKEYLDKHNNKDISHNQVDKLDEDFSGYLVYRKWDDTPEFTLRIQNGKNVRGFSYVVDQPSTKARTATVHCTTTITEHYQQTCWTLDPEMGGQICTGWQLMYVTYSQSCYDDNPNPCQYGCGGGGTGGGTPTPPPPQDGTRKADHSLPKTTKLPVKGSPTQVGSLCVFKTMEWIAIYFDKSIPSGTSLLYYCQTHNLNIAGVINGGGVPTNNLAPLVSNYFNMTPTTDIQGSINGGFPLMGTLVSGSNGHEVMITGYNNSGSIEYFDPETSTYATKPASSFHNVYKITGVK